MVSTSDIEAALSPCDSGEPCAEQSILREMLWVLSISGIDTDRAKTFDCLYVALQFLAQLVPIAKALDKKSEALWQSWAETVPLIVERLHAHGATGQRKPKPRADSYLAAWITPVADGAPSGLLPAKATWLIGRHLRYEEEVMNFAERFHLFSHDAEQNLADTIRKCCTLKWKHLDLARKYLPDWPGPSAFEWKREFLDRAAGAPGYDMRYWGGADFIHTMARILRAVPTRRPMEASQGDAPELHLSRSVRASDLAFPNNPSVVLRPAPKGAATGGKPPPFRSFDLFDSLTSNVEADVTALAPSRRQITALSESPADEATKPVAVQMVHVRYTNYRTAMDNQRLPWAWDCPNDFEIAAITSALTASANSLHAALTEKLGALLVSMLLATGQSLDLILQIAVGLGSQGGYAGALLPGFIYRRPIYAPPHSFPPSMSQTSILAQHHSHVDLQLPSAISRLADEAGIQTSAELTHSQQRTIGSQMKIDEGEAEELVRNFLAQHRSRDLRLLPGRLRNTLGREIMSVSTDPILTHLLTALPSDMPPAGVYYTSYPVTLLQRTYAEALRNIFRESQ